MYIAAVNPTGIATSMAIREDNIVPVIKGRIPKDGSAASGASLDPKNSKIETSLKNLAASVIRVNTMPSVVTTDTLAIKKKNLGMILSTLFFLLPIFVRICDLTFVSLSIDSLFPDILSMEIASLPFKLQNSVYRI
jgi:hypothetical protein